MSKRSEHSRLTCRDADTVGNRKTAPAGMLGNGILPGIPKQKSADWRTFRRSNTVTVFQQ